MCVCGVCVFVCVGGGHEREREAGCVVKVKVRRGKDNDYILPASPPRLSN